MYAVFIPTYNERENLPVIVERIKSVLKDNYIIIVVDDSSPDGTGALADELARKHPITVVHRKVRGRASASLDGYRVAFEKNADIVIEMDADLSHDPKYLPEFVKKIKDYDIVSGSRYLEGGGEANRSAFRRYLSKFANDFARLLLQIPGTDVTGGYRCYRVETLRGIDPDMIISTGYSIGIEILYRARKNGCTVGEIPIFFENRAMGESKLKMRTIIMYLIVVVRLRLGA
jgi:dolichol-phosphate mannosyltransferase